MKFPLALFKQTLLSDDFSWTILIFSKSGTGRNLCFIYSLYKLDDRYTLLKASDEIYYDLCFNSYFDNCIEKENLDIYFGSIHISTNNNKQILQYPQTLYSVQGVKTSNKYFSIPRHYTVYKGSKHQTNTLISPDTIQCTRGQNIKHIYRNRRQQLDIYNKNTCKLNTLKLTIAFRNLQQYTNRVA